MEDQIQLTVEDITPEIAREWLTHNDSNRPPRKHKVALYAKMMAADQWYLTGEPICWNGTRLMNGQHRLMGCVEADVPFRTVVARGVNAAAMAVIDTGLTRTPGDAFGFEHIPNARGIAAQVKLVIATRIGALGRPDQMRLITRPELISIYTTDPDCFQTAYRLGSIVQRAIRGGVGPWAAIAYLGIRAIGEDAATEFLDPVASGADLPNGDARLALRNWVLGRAARGQIIQGERLVAQGVKAWNYWRDGARVEHLKLWVPGQTLPSMATD